MALIDKLREIADFPISHIPTVSEASEIVGKLAAYVEHGDTLFDVAEQGAQELADLLGHGKQDTPEPEPVSPSPPGEPAPAGASPSPAAPATPTPAQVAQDPAAADASDPATVQAAATAVQSPNVEAELADIRASNAALAQQVQALLANQNKTTGTVEPAPEPAPNLVSSPQTGNPPTSG